MKANPAKVDRRKIIAFELLVAVPTLVGGGILIAHGPVAFHRYWGELIFWAALIGLVELLPVPAWRGLTISLGFPLLMVVAFLYEPAAAAAVAFVGAEGGGLLLGLAHQVQASLIRKFGQIGLDHPERLRRPHRR